MSRRRRRRRSAYRRVVEQERRRVAMVTIKGADQTRRDEGSPFIADFVTREPPPRNRRIRSLRATPPIHPSTPMLSREREREREREAATLTWRVFRNQRRAPANRRGISRSMLAWRKLRTSRRSFHGFHFRKCITSPQQMAANERHYSDLESREQSDIKFLYPELSRTETKKQPRSTGGNRVDTRPATEEQPHHRESRFNYDSPTSIWIEFDRELSDDEKVPIGNETLRRLFFLDRAGNKPAEMLCYRR